MAYQYIKGAISCSNATSYTGSFVKLQMLNNTAADGETIQIDRIETGEFFSGKTVSNKVLYMLNNKYDSKKISISAGMFQNPTNLKTKSNIYIKGKLDYYKLDSNIPKYSKSIK